MRMKYLALALVPAAFTFPAVARAATFGSDGTFAFDPSATTTLDFEEDIPNDTGSASLTVADAGALHGARVLSLEAFSGVDLPVSVSAAPATYRVSAWIRGSETVVDLEVRYADNPHPGVDELTMLYPTGRVTSDGWVEVANEKVRIDGTRGASVSVGFFSAAGGAADAVEIVRDGDLGPAERSGAFCQGSADPVCGSAQVCLFSQCRWVGGQVPPIPEAREDVADYLSARARLMFGPFENRRRDLPNAEVTFERMRTASDPWTYWNGFMLGVRQLHDGHTTTSSIGDFVLDNEKPLGLCFIEGDADLSHAVAPKDPQYLDVLVSHTAGSRTLDMVPGDRLIAIDGLHPIEWARAQIEHHWSLSTVSNHETFAELAEQLRSLVPRYAHSMTVVRCDAANATCAAPEKIDLATLPTFAEGESFMGVQCDSRPLRHLPTSPANHATGGSVLYGILNESDATERIYGSEFDSLYTLGGDGVGPGLQAAVAQFKADARGVVLDHRSGNGGTILGPQILWDFAVPRHTVSVYLDRQRAEDELPSLADGLAAFTKGAEAGFADVGGSSTHATMPIALLVTRDVSASDWLPLGLKGQAPNVKIFGPFMTNGGFSTRYGFGYWLGMNYVMAAGDTFDATGLTRNGRGVEPDIIVLPRQSDLYAGKDSVFEAALAWVRAEAGAP